MYQLLFKRHSATKETKLFRTNLVPKYHLFTSNLLFLVTVMLPSLFISVPSRL